MSLNKQCVGYLGNGCTTIATEGVPKSICESCMRKYDELYQRLTNKQTNLSNYIPGEEQMIIYECIYQQKEMTGEDCQKCFLKEMKDNYKTRAACVLDNAEKKDGSTF
jgi:hypothetical protein